MNLPLAPKEEEEIRKIMALVKSSRKPNIVQPASLAISHNPFVLGVHMTMSCTYNIIIITRGDHSTIYNISKS